jgi:hypothetical protein
VLAHEDALIECFGETLTTCDRLLDGGILGIDSIPVTEDIHYVTTDTSWRLDGEKVGVYCPKGCLLAVDPALDDRGYWWEEEGLCESGFDSIVPEDKIYMKEFQKRALIGDHKEATYHAQFNGQTKKKTIHSESYYSYSNRLFSIHHH